MGGLRDGGSVWAKISAICLIISLLLFLIAFGSSWWASTNPDNTKRNEHIGLWRFCTDPVGGGMTCGDFIDWTSGSWLMAAQSFMTLSLFGLLASIGVVIVGAFVPDFEGEPKMIVGGIIATAVTSIFMLIGIAVFAGKYEQYFTTRDTVYTDNDCQLGWSFGVAATSLLLTFASCVLMIMELAMGSND